MNNFNQDNPYDFLVLWRAKHGYTQEQASEVLLLKLRTLQRMEAGEYAGNVPIQMVKTFCNTWDNMKLRDKP